VNAFTIAMYLRLSAEDSDLKQGGKPESNSIANQRNLILDFIEHTAEFADVDVIEFCDDGWSGKNFERPAIQDMLQKVREGKIQCIIVKDISRFGRDYLTVGDYVTRIFPFLNVRFIAINDGFDSTRPGAIDSLETAFKTLLYDLYSRDISRKVRKAKMFRAQRGDFLSPFAPFGYKKDPANKNHLIIDPPAAEIVMRIFRMAASGKSTTQIARILNAEAVPTRMLYKRAAGYSRTKWRSIYEENFWTDNSVTKILRDERYIGKNVWGKRVVDVVGKSSTVKRSRKDWICVPDTHESIVTQAEFDLAQAAMREFAERDGVKQNKCTLKSKVRCGICGHVMKRSGTKNVKYYCLTSRVTTAYSCPKQVLESDIMNALLDGLHAMAAIAVDISRVWEEQHKQTKQNIKAKLKTLASLKEDYIQKDKAIKELYEAFVLDKLDKEEYLDRKTALVKQRDDTAEQISRLEIRLENNGMDGSLHNQFVDCFKQYAEIQELNQEIIADVLDTLLIYPGGRIEIVWNYEDDMKKIMLDNQMNGD